MKDKIDAAFIQHAADILAETYTGLSGGQIGQSGRTGAGCGWSPRTGATVPEWNTP